MLNRSGGTRNPLPPSHKRITNPLNPDLHPPGREKLRPRREAGTGISRGLDLREGSCTGAAGINEAEGMSLGVTTVTEPPPQAGDFLPTGVQRGN